MYHTEKGVYSPRLEGQCAHSILMCISRILACGMPSASPKYKALPWRSISPDKAHIHISPINEVQAQSYVLELSHPLGGDGCSSLGESSQITREIRIRHKDEMGKMKMKDYQDEAR